MTKHWKLKDGSSVESHSDNVDISAYANPITKTEFDAFIAGLQDTTEPDYKALYAAAATAADKIDVIAQKLGLK